MTRTLGATLVAAALVSAGLVPAAPTLAAAPPGHPAPAPTSGHPPAPAAVRPHVTTAGVPPFFEMVLDEPHGLLYGSDSAGGKIWVLSLPSLATVTSIDMGAGSVPHGIDLSPDGSTLAVARFGSENIALVDTGSRTITGVLTPLGTTGPPLPVDVRFGRPNRLYSVGFFPAGGFDHVHEFDTVSKTEVGRSTTIVDAAPRIAVTADGNTLYAMEAGQSPNALTRFDVSTDTPTVSGQAAFGQVAGVTVAVRPDGSEVYLSSGQVWSGDLAHQLGTIVNGDASVAYAPATDRVFLTSGNTLYTANGTSLSPLGSQFSSGTTVQSLRANAAGTTIYVSTDSGLDALSAANPGTPAAPTNVQAVAGISSATVTWTPPTDTGTSPITGYTIFSSGGAQASAPAGATSAVITGVAAAQRKFIVAATNASGLGTGSLPSNQVTIVAGGTYRPLTPARILDTRDGTGGVTPSPIGPGGVLTVQVAGRGGVPVTGVSAVVLNVTVTDTTAPSFLTVWPTGLTRPTVSNLNWTPGVTVPNLVEVELGGDGRLSIFNLTGNVDVIFDVVGWVGDAFDSAGRDGMFNSLQPSRLLDTRSGGTLGQGGSLTLPVAGHGGVPATGVSAVVLNVTVTDATAPSFLTVWPAGGPRPLASNLNFVAGQTVPNRVIVGLGSGGSISIFNFAGSADVVVDVDGWFTDSTSTAGGSGLLSGNPGRFFDTRGKFPAPLQSGDILQLQVPPSDPRTMTAMVLNVTATDTTASGYLTVWPDGLPRPLASDLNFGPGQTVPNLTIVGLSGARAFDIFNFQGSTDVVVDLFGFFGDRAVAPPAAMLTLRTTGEAGPAAQGTPLAARANVIRSQAVRHPAA